MSVNAIFAPDEGAFPSEGMQVNLFGGGRVAAAALRSRVLKRLGAEPEWTDGELDASIVSWKPGLPSTFFHVYAAAPGTPDLGVLEILTPVAWVGDTSAARQLCYDLNTYATTNQWVVLPQHDESGRYEEGVQVRCAFVVGPHNQEALETFVTWCVREQISTASSHIWNGYIAEKVAGAPCLFEGYCGRPARGPGLVA